MASYELISVRGGWFDKKVIQFVQIWKYNWRESFLWCSLRNEEKQSQNCAAMHATKMLSLHL